VVGPDRVTPRNLYLYLVCLIMLLVGVFAAVQLVRSTLGIAFPDTTSFGWYAEPGMDMGTGMDEEQYLQEEAEAAEDSQRRYEILEAVTAGTTLLLAGGIYALHWRRAQSERSIPAASEVPAGPPSP
jgi:hypothetical protein